jgi:hypothetical protein
MANDDQHILEVVSRVLRQPISYHALTNIAHRVLQRRPSLHGLNLGRK